MTREITPAAAVNAKVRVPGSKSITNRALVCASLARGTSILHGSSDSDDTELMCNGLNQLGVLVRREGETLVVEGTGGRLYAPKYPIPVGNAGTTLRFLLSVAAISEGQTTFQADMRMAERPMTELFDALKALGVEAGGGGKIPLFTVKGGSLNGGVVHLRSDRSSQFLSSLLMVAPLARNDVAIETGDEISSLPYVHMTVEVMKRFGVTVTCSGDRKFDVRAGQRYMPAVYQVEPDASGASYFLGAAAVAGGSVEIERAATSSLQSDTGIVTLLQQMGCSVDHTDSGVLIRSDKAIRGLEADMNTMPDIVPTLAVVALFARGKSRLLNVAHMRFKESDRLEALATELQKVGAKVAVMDDGLEIDPVPLHGAQLDPRGDHRLAMSFALIGLRVPGVIIENPQCVKKSFPAFWTTFDTLYGT